MAPDWFRTLHDSLWLRPDVGGEEEADFIQRALKLRKGQRVLDAPCGAGRVAYHLARRGIPTVGIDIRKSFIDRAKERFRNDGVEADLRAMDLRDIDFTEEFHGIYNWFNSFGYFSDEENAELMRKYVRALRTGGRLLIDQLNRERILRNFCPEVVRNGIAMRSNWNSSEQRIELRRRVDGIDDSSNYSSQRLYTPAQLCDLLSPAGLEVENFYGSLNGEDYSRGSQQMIVVARKVKK